MRALPLGSMWCGRADRYFNGHTENGEMVGKYRVPQRHKKEGLSSLGIREGFLEEVILELRPKR